MSQATDNDALRALEAFDQELRQHISHLLAIECSDAQVADLIYDAVQAAARMGQRARAAQRELVANPTETQRRTLRGE